MKCPKCGFNSFEYYDSCKKCSGDLIAYKQTYGITSVVFPLEAKEKMVAEYRSDEHVADQAGDATETHDDIFSFDLPDDSPLEPDHNNDDPFNFDEKSPDMKNADDLGSDDDVFANLLESTSQTEESLFGGSLSGAAPAKVAAKSADAAAVPGEFDLESFSWDDATGENTAAEATADFDSLFGETKETSKK